MADLDDLAVGVFAGSYVEKLRKVSCSPYEAPEIPEGTRATSAVLTRVMISSSTKEKHAVQKDYNWPLPLQPDDLDDDVPF